MSQKRSKFNRLRVESILEVGRRFVLFTIFTYGTTRKPDATPLDQYMPNCPQDKWGNFLQLDKIFNMSEHLKIRHDPTCKSFDISLLYKAIKLACDTVEGYHSKGWSKKSKKMEYYITAIKNERNKSKHGEHEITTQEYMKTATRLKKLFHNALHAARERYKIPKKKVNSIIKKVDDKLFKIKQELLGKEDLFAYCTSQYKEEFIKKANKELKKHFLNIRSIDPMSFLSGTRLHLQVQKVFTEIKVTVGRIRGKGQSVRYQDLLEAARSGPGPAQPQVLLMEGVGGSGKSAFVTLLIDEWLKDAKDRTITGLDYYDMLLHVPCWEGKITSFNCFLKDKIPQVFLDYHKFLLPLIKNCKILILIDGFHGSNPASKELISDIFIQMEGVNGCTLLLTSRPDSVTRLPTIPQEYQVSYIELVGIPESHREPFVRRYHEEMKQQIDDTQDTKKLLEKVCQVLKKEHFRLPLNMVFLTWVYIHNPSAITSTTSQTQLYQSTYQLRLHKLLDRLAHYSTTWNFDPKTLETHLKQMLVALHQKFLLAALCSQLKLNSEALNHIKVSCTDHGISPDEFLSAFLTLEVKWTHLGTVKNYSAPDEELRDFYAALYIHHKVITSSASIRNVMEETLGKLDKNMRPLQNVLYHVAGLLHFPPNAVLQTITEEVVDILCESRMRTRDQWLDLVKDTIAVLQTVSEEVVDMLYESGMTTREKWLSLVEDTRGNPAILHRMTHYFPPGHAMWDELKELLHHYKDPTPFTTCDQLLHQVLLRSPVKPFHDHLLGDRIRLHPHHLHTQKAMYSFYRQLPSEGCLKIHVPVARATLSSLTPVSSREKKKKVRVILVLSGITDQLIKKACRMAKALQGPDGYHHIKLPRASLSNGGWTNLLQGLKEAGVRVRMISMKDNCEEQNGHQASGPCQRKVWLQFEESVSRLT